MKDKCEWKDGVLNRCDKSRLWLSIDSRPNGMVIYLRNSTFIIDFCPCCGADIRKRGPAENNKCRHRGSKISSTYQCLRGNECLGVDYRCNIYEQRPAEPLIMDSGDTIVCEWTDGINYLCIDVEENIALMKAEHEIFETIMKLCWKSFTGPNPDITELTDEIAKLRPMVISEAFGKCKLYGIDFENDCILKPCNGVKDLKYMGVRSVRLATAQELQDSQK